VKRREPTLRAVALEVGQALKEAGIQAVLTGGACASIHSRGAYSSIDLDFVLSGRVTQVSLDRAMASIRFHRHRDRYVREDLPYFVEFPPGPLAVGGDTNLAPVVLRSGSRSLRLLSPTDACRDRLAAFYHWSDRQSLAVAVAIALRHRVLWKRIRSWSTAGGAGARFEEFHAEVKRARSEQRP